MAPCMEKAHHLEKKQHLTQIGMKIMFTIRNKIRDNFDIRLETILTFMLIFKQTFVIRLVFLSRSTSAFCCQILTWVN